MKNSKLTLALMAGLPGTGKSTLARALGTALDWYVIDKDRFKDEFREQGFEEEKARRAAYRQSFAIAREKLTVEETSVILDSAVLDSQTLENAMDIIRSYENIQLKVILCITSRELRNERARNKLSSSYTRDDPITRNDYLQRFKHLPSDRLELDTDDPLETYLEDAKAYLTGKQTKISLPL